MNGFLNSQLAAPLNEARTLAHKFGQDSSAYADLIICHLEAIHQAITADQWDEKREKYDRVILTGDTAVKDIDTVPMGTEWVLECFTQFPLGAVLLLVNGKPRAIASTGGPGPGTVHLNGGDVVQIQSQNAPGADTSVYLQFLRREIRSPRARSAGQPTVGADKPNDAAETLERSSTPGIVQTAPIRGDSTVRHPHMPPALPRV